MIALAAGFKMLFSKFEGYFTRISTGLVIAIVIPIGLLAVNLRTLTSTTCVYRGSESAERQPIVVNNCLDTSQSLDQWQENLRIIRKYVVYDGSFAGIIFSNAMTDYAAEGSEENRTHFSDEVHLYSRFLALGAQTADKATAFKKGISLEAKLWAMQFRLAHYIIEGPLTWTFPQTNQNFEIWQRFYIATIQIPANAFKQMCETFEEYRNACVSPEFMPSAYIWEDVNNGPAKDECTTYSVNE